MQAAVGADAGLGHLRDEAIAVLGHGFDELRPGRIVAQRAAQRLDALRQRFVRDRYARPDLVEEAVPGHQVFRLPGPSVPAHPDNVS